MAATIRRICDHLTIHNSHDSRNSKRQLMSTATVHFRTTLTWTVTLNSLLIILFSFLLQFKGCGDHQWNIIFYISQEVHWQKETWIDKGERTRKVARNTKRLQQQDLNSLKTFYDQSMTCRHAKREECLYTSKITSKGKFETLMKLLNLKLHHVFSTDMDEKKSKMGYGTEHVPCTMYPSLESQFC